MIYIKSIQGKLTILLGILIVFFSLLENINLYALLIQALGIFIIARNIDCYVYGKCILGAWIGLMIPTFVFLLMLMSKISYFDNTKRKLVSLIKYFNKMNSSRCDISKNILKKVDIKYKSKNMRNTEMS